MRRNLRRAGKSWRITGLGETLAEDVACERGSQLGISTKTGRSGHDTIADLPYRRHPLGMRAGHRKLAAFLLTAGATVLALCGCANEQQRVAGHYYEVPDANLIPLNAYPFFLPKSEIEGFIFVLNPDAELRQQRSALVQDRERLCARANGHGYVSQTICGSQSIEWKDRGWRKTGDETFWTYSPDTTPAADAPFVTCHKMEIDGHPGLCAASLPLGDLVLTISLNDDELPTLEAIYQRAATMLLSWEV